MSDILICPNCKHKIPLSEAISHQIDETYKLEIAQLKQKNEEEREKLIAFSKKRIQEEKEKTAQEVEKELKTKIQEELSVSIKNSENEAKELKEQRKKLQDQLLALNTTIRQLQNESREKEIQMVKRLTEERVKIEDLVLKRAQEEHRMKDLEKEKVIEDLKKSLEDARRRAEQGSQQMQGEVFELAIEGLLRKTFPEDEIIEVPKGATGADLIQIVRTKQGKVCGKIVWEVKRAKSWSGSWIPKLRNDQRTTKAELAVLVSEVLPENISHFGNLEGVWICGYPYASGIAHILRSQLIEITVAKSALEGKSGKMELLFSYVNSIEFTHRVEAILEAFSNMHDEIEKEKKWFYQKWAREERNLRSVFDNTCGMSGELQSITGNNILDLTAESTSKTEVPRQIEDQQDRLV